ncbi:MAG: manganese efflux pump [Oscillospiraceae bacterium]|nr:manganese efflux pump [Oscillospiraceae bacterium]
MDAFAVSVCKGLAVKEVKIKHLVLVGAWFGAFQALMPLAGYFLGSSFHSYIEKVDYLIAFVLLLIIGANMLKEAFSGDEGKPADASFGVKTMLLMAIATSIDALAAGIALAMDETVNIWLAVLIIGVTTFILSAAGVKIGSIFGEKYQKKARIAGGVVLILIGLKTLLEHFGIL